MDKAKLSSPWDSVTSERERVSLFNLQTQCSHVWCGQVDWVNTHTKKRVLMTWWFWQVWLWKIAWVFEKDHLCYILVCNTDWIISLQGLPGPPGKSGQPGKRGPRVSFLGYTESSFLRHMFICKFFKQCCLIFGFKVYFSGNILISLFAYLYLGVFVCFVFALLLLPLRFVLTEGS